MIFFYCLSSNHPPRRTNADVNPRTLLSRANLGDVKGGGGTGGIPCFCCVTPHLFPQKGLFCMLLPSFSPPSPFLPLHCPLPTRRMHAFGHRARARWLLCMKEFFHSLFTYK